MADITKCINGGCPIRFGCYRWRAKDSVTLQSVQEFQYHEDSDGEIYCDHLIDMKHRNSNNEHSKKENNE